MKQGSHLSCFFKREKHGALVRRDFSHMMQKGRGRIGFCHGRCFRAQFALKGAHASPSLLAHAAGRSRGPAKNAPRGFLPSHGLPPTMAAFRRKVAQLQIQLRGKPRIPTGFLLIPPPRSGARDDDTMYAFICTKYHAGLQLSMSFSLPAAFSRCPPKIRIERNPLRRQAPKGGGCGFWPAPG